MDHDDIPGAEFDSSAYQSEEDKPAKIVAPAKKSDAPSKLSPKASLKKAFCPNKRTSKQVEKR